MPKAEIKTEPAFDEMVKRAGTSVVEALQAGGHAGLDIDQNNHIKLSDHAE